jgi:hypothetical protein
MIQKELLNELSRQSVPIGIGTYRTIAGTLEQGTPMVMDVPACPEGRFDEPPSPTGFGGGTKIVFRKPINEKESRSDGRDGHGKAKKSKVGVRSPCPHRREAMDDNSATCHPPSASCRRDQAIATEGKNVMMQELLDSTATIHEPEEEPSFTGP